MKKVLFSILVCTMLVSCMPVSPRYSVEVNHIDYSYFKQKGIFVTEALSVNFEYESIGTLSIIERAGDITVEKTNMEPNRKSADDVYERENSSETSEETIYKTSNIQNVLEYICNETSRVGGNGLLNLKITYLPPTISKQGRTANEGIMITGMVIKK